jgi:L-ascorbate metabolism protein UlaG (beta-lactamase superfamily)
MQIIRHGHSFIEIETSHGSYVIDPFINDNPKCDVTIDDMAKKNIRGIFLTHGHGDHLGETLTLHRLTNAPIVCEYGLATRFEHHHSIVCTA